MIHSVGPDSLLGFTGIYSLERFLYWNRAQKCTASIACGHPHAHFWGVPQTPALFLRDDSDADDANDAVLGISLYHIPDSASLASSASF